MGRAGCFLIFVTGALLWYGGQSLYTAISNRTPTSMSSAEYAKAKPKAEWLELTQCNLAITDGMHSEKSGSIQEIYLPVFAPSDKTSDKIHVLLATRNTSLMGLYQAAGNLKNEEQVRQFLIANKDRLYGQTIKGLVRFGINLKDKDRSKLASLDKSLSPDFIIIDDGKEPSMAMGLGMTGGGLLLLVVGGLYVLRSRKGALAPPPPPA
jgi:hypothetical protein